MRTGVFMEIKGRCWKFGDNINTDLILPARYMTVYEAAELGKHCMEDVDPEIPKKVQPGDIVVAGENFGCGSSREQSSSAAQTSAAARHVSKQP